MNKKVVILAIFAVYLLTITIITAVIIAGKKEAKPLIIPRAAKQEAAQGSERKKTAPQRRDTPATVSEKEFEPPIEGPLLQ